MTVTVGPEALSWGSWDWIGCDTRLALRSVFDTCAFHPWEEISADVVVIVKHRPPDAWIEQTARRSRLIYAPVDAYDSTADIDADAAWLRRCSRIVVHYKGLRKHFASYSLVEYLDHHVKFVAPIREDFRSDGNLLWVGVRSNLAPLVR